MALPPCTEINQPVNFQQGLHRAAGEPHIKPGRHTEFPWIDTHQTPTKFVNDALTEVAHGRDGRTSAQLHNHWPAYVRQPSLHAFLLFDLPVLYPLKICEHQHVGPCQTTTLRANRHRIQQQALLSVQFRNEVIGSPNRITAWLKALQLVNRTVTFLQGGRLKPCFLELPIDIAREHCTTQRHVLTPSIQYLESRMWLRFTIQLEAMSVKTPCTLWLGVKGFWAGNTVKINLFPPECWVCLPESFFTSEVGQPRIDAHSRACGHDQSIGL